MKLFADDAIEILRGGAIENLRRECGDDPIVREHLARADRGDCDLLTALAGCVAILVRAKNIVQEETIASLHRLEARFLAEHIEPIHLHLKPLIAECYVGESEGVGSIIDMARSQ